MSKLFLLLLLSPAAAAFNYHLDKKKLSPLSSAYASQFASSLMACWQRYMNTVLKQLNWMNNKIEIAKNIKRVITIFPSVCRRRLQKLMNEMEWNEWFANIQNIFSSFIRCYFTVHEDGVDDDDNDIIDEAKTKDKRIDTRIKRAC